MNTSPTPDQLDAFIAALGGNGAMFSLFGGGGEVSGTRTTNPGGRPLSPKTQAIREAVSDLTERFKRMTVRQVFYQLETMRVVAKTEGGYRQVQKQLADMRRQGLLRWTFITDGTRWQRKPSSHTDAKSYIESFSRSYRRDLWQEQGLRIEFWLEKDALADVVWDATNKWDVSLMVSRGQSSLSFLHSAAREAERAWEEDGLETVIYALYDYDAGGDRAFRKIESDLPEFAPHTPIKVERLAVTAGQITAWSLPTRPPKKSDPEAKKWGSKPAVELDAIDPTTLTALVEAAIESHVDADAWRVQKAVEAEERKGLLALAGQWDESSRSDG